MLKIMIYGVGQCGRYIWDEIRKHKNPQVCMEGWIDNFTKEKFEMSNEFACSLHDSMGKRNGI